MCISTTQPARAGTGRDAVRADLGGAERAGYAGRIGVEPFDYVPDGPGSAARAIGYLSGLLEA